MPHVLERKVGRRVERSLVIFDVERLVLSGIYAAKTVQYVVIITVKHVILLCCRICSLFYNDIKAGHDC